MLIIEPDRISTVHTKAAQGRLLDESGDERPALVRGDFGYGNEDILRNWSTESRPTCCVCARRPNAPRLVARQFARQRLRGGIARER